MKIKKLILTLLFIPLMIVCNSRVVFSAELSINLVALNPSETEEKEIDVKYLLPKELEPSDVLDSGELKVEYDVDKMLYFVSGKVKFNPKESKTFKIRVNDVWNITPEEISVLKQNMDGNLSLMEGNPQVYDNAKRERDKIFEQLDIIQAQQQSYVDNIERRIEQYRAYSGIVEKIRKKIYDPNFLEKEVQVDQQEDEGKTIKFVLQVKNPSNVEEKTIKHKHFLPDEIREEHIIDKQGFDIRFDDKKGKSYLLKEEKFTPGEEKKYEVVMRDIWRFPVNKLDPMEKRAQVAIEEMKDSAYAASGQYLFDNLMKNIELIRETQNAELPPDKHIGIFRTNEKRYEDVKQSVERIEQMLSIVRAKKLEELEGSKVKNVLKRLQALRGLQALSEAIFKKGITVTMTWRIIGGCIAFIAFFTAYHFFLWARRSSKMADDSPLKPGEEIKVVPKPTPPTKHS
ncbi:MAG: DUF861 domain-containing protein [Candidatus Omnitrophica bacterium]|nr:DUF861 domain-containing protein [Candidatus Omnitrophota bacterium]